MITPKIRAFMKEQAAAHAPAECGGAIVSTGLRDLEIVLIPNESTSPKRVRHNPAEIASIDRETPIQAYWHTHVDQSAMPSEADRVGCSASGLPWFILSHPAGQLERVGPTPFELPLVGREFCHGSVDCYTLIKDYYSQLLQIDLPEFYRPDDWWKPKSEGGLGLDLYRQGLERAGFEELPFDPKEVRQHDVLLMTVRSPKPNHGAVYLGDSMIMHHFQDCLSQRTFYSQYWQQRTTLIARRAI